LNEDYQVENQIPDAGGCVEEGCNEAAPGENYGHKATIKAPEHFSSIWVSKSVDNRRQKRNSP
jgi:hypothetical protein